MDKIKYIQRLKAFYIHGVVWFLCTFFGTSVVSQVRFTDVSREAGIQHVFKVYEGMFGGGACVLDFNNDGYEDVYITGGMNDDVMYQNNGDGSFTNVFESLKMSDTKQYVTQGVSGADVNRDGFVDLFITTITRRDKKEGIPREINLLFLNNGNGTFRNATEEYGLGKMYSFSTGGSFGDFNADGWPDLYVGNYFNEYEGKLSVINDNTVVGANQIAKGYLLVNRGGKKFEEVNSRYGLAFRGFGFGGVFTDYDNDDDQDLIINHDFGYKRTPDMLLRNDYPQKSFSDLSKESALDIRINSMGTAVGDYNNDGWMDYFYTNIRFNYFMVNQGNGKPFVNEAVKLGLDVFAISWGANFADFDHDGDLDLFVANGDLNPNCVAMADFYFENDGKAFKEKGREAGINDYGIGRGSVMFDYDNDGDLDLLVVNQEPVCSYPVESVTRLYRNEKNGGRWLKIALKGIDAESHGIGSRVEVMAQGKKMIREIDGGGSSHISQNSVIAHFGLRNADSVELVTVKWTGGNVQMLKNIKSNQLIVITEIPGKKIGYSDFLVPASILIAVSAWFIWRKRKKVTAPAT